jgi:protein involved in polysaccharide export with SLBB domain
MRFAFRGTSFLAALVLSLAFASGTARAQQPQEPAVPGQNQQSPLGPDTSFDPSQPIKPGFILSVTVSSAAGVEQDLSGTFPVDPSGAITMRIVGPVQVGGLTPTQAGDLIAGKVKTLIKDPTVKVSIVSVPRPTVIFGGQVPRPGVGPIVTGTTLGEALTVFGYSDNADLTRVRVIRPDAMGNRTVREYNVLRWLKPNPGQAPDETQNPVIQDRDFIFLQPKAIAPVGVVRIEGNVTRPGVVPVETGLPTMLREVISRAGGLTQTASRRRISLRRIGVERPMLFDADRVEAGDPTHNIAVLPEDIIYVESLPAEGFVNLNGAFIRPGKLPYARPITLTQATGEAGGLIPTAKAGEGRIYRFPAGADPTRTQVIAFNYDKIRRGKASDILLEPGDTVEVPLGNAPRPALSGLELTQSLLSIALIVDRLLNPGRQPF